MIVQQYDCAAIHNVIPLLKDFLQEISWLLQSWIIAQNEWIFSAENAIINQLILGTYL